MRIAALGLRAFPNVQGGVETHAEHLYPLLAEQGCEVHVITRSPYHDAGAGNLWKGVHFHRVWAPRSKGAEAVVGSFLGVLYAGFVLRPDLLHIQAIGPALMAPLARLLGLRVVVTHHGPDYDRQKWGRFAKSVLRLGERLGMRWSNARIVISEVIREIVREKYGMSSTVISNGVDLPRPPGGTGTPEGFGLTPGKYILLVSRLVPEKRHHDLIAAFKLASPPGWKLALVGASDHPDAYVDGVLAEARSSADIVCTGLQTGQGLQELYGHAGMFVLPSSHEGLPIVMLEALSFGLPVIASAIPANLEVGLPPEHYFPLGDVEMLAERLAAFAARPGSTREREARRSWVASRYDWREIAERTLDVYRAVCGESSQDHGRVIRAGSL